MVDNTILFVVNDADFFLSHRAPIAIHCRDIGYKVIVAANGNVEAKKKICDLGLEFIDLRFSRSGQNLMYEFITIVSLLRVLMRIKPDVLHLVTIKPVIYGGILARFLRLRRVVVAISGLGVAFSPGNKFESLRLSLIKAIYKFISSNPRSRFIFQNDEDKKQILSLGKLSCTRSYLIPGSGVDLGEYRYREEPQTDFVVVFAARLLVDKGVRDFVEAARILRDRGNNFNFRLIGKTDPGNPNSITNEELQSWSDSKVVSVLGFRSDIADQYMECHLVCLPSYYGEGLPKSLIEAAACGRPILTSNMPGCRDAIIDGVTGVLLPCKNPIALADAIESLAENPDVRKKMGIAARKYAEDTFSLESVIAQHMVIYRS